MTKVVINLYPGGGGEDNKFRRILVRYFPYVFIAVVVAFSLNLLLIAATAVSSLPYRSLRKKWHNIEPEVAGIDRLKEELDALRAQENKYKGLLDRNFSVAHILADIFAALPRNVWLDEIRFKEGSIKFTGYIAEWKTSTSASFDAFIKKLKKQEYFSRHFTEVVPKSQRSITIAGRKAMRFEVECRSSN